MVRSVKFAGMLFLSGRGFIASSEDCTVLSDMCAGDLCNYLNNTLTWCEVKLKNRKRLAVCRTGSRDGGEGLWRYTFTCDTCALIN